MATGLNKSRSVSNEESKGYVVGLTTKIACPAARAHVCSGVGVLGKGNRVSVSGRMGARQQCCRARLWVGKLGSADSRQLASCTPSLFLGGKATAGRLGHTLAQVEAEDSAMRAVHQADSFGTAIDKCGRARPEAKAAIAGRRGHVGLRRWWQDRVWQ